MTVLDKQVGRLLDGYSLAAATLRQRLVQHVGGLWTNLGAWRDADVARFASQAATIVNAGRRQTASLTDGYLAAMSRAVTGAGQPIGITDAVLDGIRGGAPLEEVYARPGATVWTAVSKGLTWEAGVAQGLTRLQSMVATDMQLARTFTALEVFSNDSRVIGYMRVTSGACCELCDVASDNAYSSDDLMPIHNNCNCDVEPLYADHDTTDLSDRQTSRVTSDMGDKPAVEIHGELGPVLVVAGQSFTGADDLAA